MVGVWAKHADEELHGKRAEQLGDMPRYGEKVGLQPAIADLFGVCHWHEVNIIKIQIGVHRLRRFMLRVDMRYIRRIARHRTRKRCCCWDSGKVRKWWLKAETIFCWVPVIWSRRTWSMYVRNRGIPTMLAAGPASRAGRLLEAASGFGARAILAGLLAGRGFFFGSHGFWIHDVSASQ